MVMVLVDDMRWDEMRIAGHPFVDPPQMDRLAREGARFLNAFATTPLCSPSRASFLTGQYAHTNGIIDNTARPSHGLRGIDLAPTLLELAGLPAGAERHGRSLVPLFQQAAPEWRSSFLVEYYSDTTPRIQNMGYIAARTTRHKYIQYRELRGMDELYDLEADPYEEIKSDRPTKRPIGARRDASGAPAPAGADEVPSAVSAVVALTRGDWITILSPLG
jgi:arylsulfatase A-like enzyme